MSYALQAPLPEQAFGHSALAPATRARKTATERIVDSSTVGIVEMVVPLS